MWGEKLNNIEKAITLIGLLGGPPNIRRVDVVLSGVDGLIFVITDTHKPDIDKIKALDSVIDVEVSNTVITVRFSKEGESKQLFREIEMFFQLYDRNTP